MKKNRKPLRRTGTPTRKTRVKRVNRKRRKESFARAYGGKRRVEWIKAQHCCVAKKFVHSEAIENVHIKTGGAGRKADASFVVAMCSRHHAFLHSMGRETFERFYSIDLDTEAAITKSRWLAFSGAQEQDA